LVFLRLLYFLVEDEALFHNKAPFDFSNPSVRTDYENDEICVLERNPIFHYAADIDVTTTESFVPTTPTTNSTTSSSTGPTFIPEESWSLAVSISIGGLSSVIIVYCLVLIVRHRHNEESI